ncbi:MAG: cytochrome c biogenesis CcdA family protein [Candidatus Thorarchaeota archaeon]|jgi:thiol:disulfide interchange protein DsbD
MLQIIELTQLAAAFLSGLYIATSPCIFPLLPLFLIRSLSSADNRSKSVIVTLALTAGILSSLALFFAISGLIGRYILQNYTVLQAVLGGIVIFLGIVTVSSTLKEKLRLTSLSIGSQPEKPTGLPGVFLVGFGYSLLAAPCSGTVILGLFALFGAQTEALVLVMMFIMLSIAVMMPYLAIALATGEARTRIAMQIANSAKTLEYLVGALLIVIGIILMYPWLSSYISALI